MTILEEGLNKIVLMSYYKIYLSFLHTTNMNERKQKSRSKLLISLNLNLVK